MAQHTRKGAKVQALTANRLQDGIVVYLTPDNHWSEKMQDADVADGPEEAAALLARGQAFLGTNDVVDVYLFAVEGLENGSIHALSVREVIRQAGPTVRLDLGKQAEGKV